MLINVTQEIIERSKELLGPSYITEWGQSRKKINASLCPVSLAIKEVVNQPYVSCGISDAQIGIDNENYDSCSLPSVASAWIKRFDIDENSAEPFSFELNYDN